MGFVYGDKVQVVATGERAKINRVFEETYQVEYTTGELQEMRPDELEPAPPPAAASEGAASREQVAAITARAEARQGFLRGRFAVETGTDGIMYTSDAGASWHLIENGEYAQFAELHTEVSALENALAAAEETVKFREATIRDLCDKLDLEGIDCDDCRDFAATADDANALADGGE